MKHCKLSRMLGKLGMVLVMFATSNSFGQQPNSENDEIMIVEIKNLDTQSYKDIVLELRATPGISSTKSCVPSSLILLTVDTQSNTLDAWFDSFEQLVKTKTDLEEIYYLNDFSEADFDSKCSMTRMGIQPDQQ